MFRYYPDEYKVDKKARSYKQANVILKNINKVSFKEMTKEQLQAELIKKNLEIARLKKLSMVMRYGKHGIRWSLNIDYEIKSKSKHERQKYRKPRGDSKNYDNLILNKLAPEEPFKIVVSDMTTMKYKGNYYEVTWYMDLFTLCQHHADQQKMVQWKQ